MYNENWQEDVVFAYHRDRGDELRPGNIYKNKECVGVLDLDSYQFETFNQDDAQMLEALCKIISTLF